MLDVKPPTLLKRLFNTAISAVSAEACIPPHLPAPPRGETVVVGAGKAAAAMAHSVEKHWPTSLRGVVVTRYAHSVACQQVEVIEASHPIPDQTAVDAANKIIAQVGSLNSNDLVLALVSGGGSALLTSPAPGITLNQKQDVNRQLLRCGATINEINCVRKHLSRIKGGRLAQHCAPAKVHGLLISDVPNDDMATIASGPTVPDPTTRQDALAVLVKFDIPIPEQVHKYLSSESSESPKPGQPLFTNVVNTVIATGFEALSQAAALAAEYNVTPITLGHNLEGEARTLGAAHARMAQQLANFHTKPFVVLSGGETTVSVTGHGRGGRNVEYLLGLAIALNDTSGIYALAADTDGIDGTEDNAGAIITPDTLARARARGLDPHKFLEENDAYSFFKALGDLIITGPTLTNVNDFRAIYAE